MIPAIERFIQSFVTQEYEVMLQIRTESDTPSIEANIIALNQFFQGLDSGLSVSPSRAIEERNTVEQQLQPRVLFQIKQYAHPTLGILYRAYLSSPFRGDRNYFTNFYIADTERGWKIIARYNLCNDCNGTGNRSGSPCDECHGFGWNWRGGEHLETLGTLKDTRQLEPPEDPQQLQEYRSV